MSYNVGGEDTKIKICKICYNKFIPKKNEHKYCSEICQKQARKLWLKKYRSTVKCKKKARIYHSSLEYRERAKNYPRNQPDVLKKYNRNRLLFPRGIFSHLKFSAKKRNLELNFSKEDFIKWYNNQEQKCYYCKRTLEEIKKDTRERIYVKYRLSIDRKNNKLGYTLDNIALACWRCNQIKSDYFTEEEMLILGGVISQLV